MSEGPSRGVDVVVLAGGTAVRLGGVSKPDVVLAGRRLLDHVLDGLSELSLCGMPVRRVCVVAPESVRVPAGVLRALEDPPLGGPVAGIGAGLLALADAAAHLLPEPGRDETGLSKCPTASLTAVLTCDAPLAWQVLPALYTALAAATQPADGAVLRTREAEGGEQLHYLAGLYRTRALRAEVAPGGVTLRDVGVRRTLRHLDLLQVPAGAHSALAEAVRDLDTWEDVAAYDGARYDT